MNTDNFDHGQTIVMDNGMANDKNNSKQLNFHANGVQ